MKIKLYQFSKRKNSTKQPTTGTEIDAYLKSPCSVLHPVFKFKLTSNTNFNYISCDLHGKTRYYFVDEITFDNSVMEVSCSEDVLSTNKTNIAGCAGHIARCSNSSWYNKLLPDNLNPISENYTISRVIGDVLTGTSDPQTVLFHESKTDGTFILTICGKSSATSTGFTVSYALGFSELYALNQKFNTHSFIDNIMKEFTNPLESVVSCKFVPIKSTDMMLNSVSEHIYIGSYDTEVSAKRLTSEHVYGGIILDLPTVDNDYLKTPPYTEYSVYLPFVGVVPLDYHAVKSTKFMAFCHVDVITGDTIYKITEYDANDPDKILVTFSGNCATEIPVSSSQFSASTVATGVLTAIGGTIATVATGGFGIPAVGAMLGGVGMAIKGTETHTQINGSLSTALSAKVETQVHIIIVKKLPAHNVTELVNFEGLPCHRQSTPQVVGGYVQFVNASIQGQFLSGEQDEINNFLNTGFYYE